MPWCDVPPAYGPPTTAYNRYNRWPKRDIWQLIFERMVAAGAVPEELSIGRRMPQGPQVHLMMDNYATHKTPKANAWLARRPHWHVHLTPTSSSWTNQVERWFAELARKQLQRGIHRSTAELEADIHT